MNIIKTLLPAILVVAACNSSVKNSQKADSTAVNMEQSDTILTARMTISPVVSKDGPLELSFTVYNQTDSTRTFCKWHTPFEPLMSKYLDITINNQEVAYKGPMAKRMMPPPADSYVSVAPGDSLSVKTDLLKAYEINTPGDYTIRYNAEHMSGLKVADSIRFTLK